MKLDSLLNTSNESGIKKIGEHSKKQKEKAETNKKLKSAESAKSVLPTKVDGLPVSVGKRGRGRPRVYDDPRFISNEPARVSAHVKIKLQNLIDQKFDGYSQSQLIDKMIDYYIENALPEEERLFLNRIVETAMEDLKSDKKYAGYF